MESNLVYWLWQAKSSTFWTENILETFSGDLASFKSVLTSLRSHSGTNGSPVTGLQVHSGQSTHWEFGGHVFSTNNNPPSERMKTSGPTFFPGIINCLEGLPLVWLFLRAEMVEQMHLITWSIELSFIHNRGKRKLKVQYSCFYQNINSFLGNT